MIEDVHNFGSDYDKSLLCWNARFQHHVGPGGAIQRPEAFVRMWEFYVLNCDFSKKRAARYDTIRYAIR